MSVIRLLIAAIFTIAIGVGIVTLTENNSKEDPMTPAAVQLPIEGQFPSLGGTTEWLNSPPLSAADLKGKVVIVDFWTYTCVNWLRTFPYVRAWAAKYKDQGLVVIGVHTPEFSFEHNLDNVRQESSDFKVDYPIAVDNDYAIWNAFDNNYWPALYFIDAQGHIRHHQFGEGNYDQSERVIQQLLTEAGRSDAGSDLVTVAPRGLQVAADWANLQSPETYLGADRTENFVSPGGAIIGDRRVYATPMQLTLNQWALSGDWTVGSEATLLNQPNGWILYRFHARDVNLVMGPATPGSSVRFRVSIDGKSPGSGHGVDVDEQGNGIVSEQRTYQLIRQPGAIADQQFEIEFLDPGAQVFDFTFG